jgi:hypothetical protein
MRFRSGKSSTLGARMFGIGYDSGFYEGGSYLFVQFGHRVFGLWWGQ